jgi:N-acetylneuraminate synthase
MRKMVIGGQRVGPGHPCFIIAEIGLNHNGSEQRARKLIDAAVAAGANAVKFQNRQLKEIYTEEYLRNPNVGEHGFNFLLPVLKEFELAPQAMRRLAAYARKRGILFLSTPWDPKSVDFLEELEVPAYKISSADLTNTPLLEYVARKGKPMIVSTGMSTEEEIRRAVKLLRKLNATFALLHCVSTYPAPYDRLNLRYIQKLQELAPDAPVGYSGHELGTTAAVAAVTLGACIIEKHLTADRKLPGPDHKASLLPREFKRLVRAIRKTEAALGQPRKVLTRGEVLNQETLRKSIVAARPIKKGEIITRDMLAIKGPGKGLSPQRLPEILGKLSPRDYQKDEWLTEEFFPPPPKIEWDSPFTWGFKARYGYLKDLERYQPHWWEFHMSEEDAVSDWLPARKYPQRLAVHCSEYLGRRMVDLCSADPEHRAASRKLITDTIARACALAPYFSGTPRVIVHVGGMSVVPRPQEREAMLERLDRELGRLPLKDVEFLLENLPPRPWYFGGQWTQNIFARPEEIVEMLSRHRLGFCLDTSHAALACNVHNLSLTDFVRQLLPWTVHVHVSDAASTDEEGLQIGEGEINFPEIFQLFREKQDLPIIPEIWRGHLNGYRGFFVALERLAPLVSYKALGIERPADRARAATPASPNPRRLTLTSRESGGKLEH